MEGVSDLTYEVITGSPSLAPRLLRQIHAWAPPGYPDDLDAAQARTDATDAFCDAMTHSARMVPGHVANALVRMATDILLEREFGGCVIAQIVPSNLGIYAVYHCTSLLYLLHVSMVCLASMSRAFADLGTRQGFGYKQEITLHLNRLLDIWTRIDNAKHVILSSDNLPNLKLAIVETFSASMALYRACPVPGFIRTLEKSSAFPILVQIWVISNVEEIRHRALEVFHDGLNIISREVTGADKRIFSQNPIMCKQVVQAGFRDLRTLKCVNAHMSRLFFYMPGSRNLARGVKISDVTDYRVFGALLAAFRTMMCSSTTSEEPPPSWVWYNDYIRYTWGGGPRSDPRLSEEDIYHMVCVVNLEMETCLQHVAFEVTQELITSIEETRRTLAVLCHKVENGRNTLIGEELSVRRRDYLRSFCRAFWSATVVSVRRNSALRDNRTIQRALDAYIRFGKLLGMGDPSNVSPYPGLDQETLFRVCHWRGCLCSTFKPRHPLKQCKGCERVFYCNLHCQACDWVDGGHEEDCRLFQSTGRHAVSSQKTLFHDRGRYLSSQA